MTVVLVSKVVRIFSDGERKGVAVIEKLRLLALIEQRLDDLGVGKPAIAKLCGVSPNWIYEYKAERGFAVKRATPEIVDKLVAGLGLDPEAAHRAAALDAGYHIAPLVDDPDVVVLAYVPADATPEEREQALHRSLDSLRRARG